jgi:hypothetical protein
MRAWMTAAALCLVCLVPEGSQACSVCFSGTDENRTAFIVTTAFMTALPLILIGSVVWWLAQRVRRLERTAAAEPVRRSRPAPVAQRPASSS